MVSDTRTLIDGLDFTLKAKRTVNKMVEVEEISELNDIEFFKPKEDIIVEEEEIENE